MLDSLQWPSLESRRRNARLVMLYKILHQTIACPLIRSKLLAAPKRQRRGHMTNNSNWLHREPSTEEALLCPVPLGNGKICPVELYITSETLDTFVSRLVHCAMGIRPQMLKDYDNDSTLEQRSRSNSTWK